MYKVVILDWDGVVTPDSEKIKRGAWPAVYAKKYSGNDLDRALEFNNKAKRQYGGGRGGDRFDILRYVYRSMGEHPDSIEELVRTGAVVFDEQVQEGILAFGISKETRAAIEDISKTSGIFLYVNTATPTESMLRTVEALGVGCFFRAVLGRPNSKIQNFELVVEECDVKPQEILFVGDSLSDFEAAQVFGCSFLGFSNGENYWDETRSHTTIRSLSEVKKYL